MYNQLRPPRILALPAFFYTGPTCPSDTSRGAPLAGNNQKKEITPQSATQHTHTLPSKRAHHTHREPLSANPGRHPQRVDPAQVHALAALELLEVPWWVYARVGWMAAVHVIAPCDTHFVQLGESHRTPGLGDGTAPRRRPSGARRQV